MPGPPAASSEVTFTIEQGGGRPVLRVESTGTRAIDVLTLPLNPEALDLIRSRVPERLEAFRDVVWDQVGGGIGRLPKPGADLALAALRRTGFEILRIALRDQDITALSAYLRRAWGGRRFDPFGATSPTLVIRGDEWAFVPFEWTPILAPSAPPNSTPDAELLAHASCFPVFAACVRREPLVDGAGAPPSIGHDDVRIRFLRNGRLGGAQVELDHLGTLQGISLDGPHPSSGAHDEIERLVFDPPPADVLHFACHAGPDATSAREIELLLRLPGPVDAELPVTLGELREWVGERAIPSPGSQVARPTTTAPVVWLNACSSAKPTLLGASLLPRFFLEQRTVNVVGVETVVPDRVAAEVSRTFYRAWMSGMSVSRALHHARLHRLRVNWDPMGAIYTAFGATDARVPAHLRRAA